MLSWARNEQIEWMELNVSGTLGILRRRCAISTQNWICCCSTKRVICPTRYSIVRKKAVNPGESKQRKARVRWAGADMINGYQRKVNLRPHPERAPIGRRRSTSSDWSEPVREGKGRAGLHHTRVGYPICAEFGPQSNRQIRRKQSQSYLRSTRRGKKVEVRRETSFLRLRWLWISGIACKGMRVPIRTRQFTAVVLFRSPCFRVNRKWSQRQVQHLLSLWGYLFIYLSIYSNQELTALWIRGKF